MKQMLRTLLFALLTGTGLGVAAQGHLIYVIGHANPCNPAMNGSPVTITVQGVTSGPVSITTTLNENCYYNISMLVPDTAGLVTVTGSCGNGTAATGTGTYSLEPPFTADVIVDLTCEAPLDCENVAGGTALPGTPCDDGDPETYFDTWTPGCQCIGGTDEDNFITVSGTVIGCTGAGLPVRIIGQGHPWVDHIVYTDANCGYSYTFYSVNETGMIEVNTSCNGGITQIVENAPWTSNPSAVTLDLECAGNSLYQVHVQGQVSPCDLLDNTVTVRCTTCNPWVEVVVPVDANCQYNATLEVVSLTGTIAVITGCSNGLVPNNAMQYIVNEPIGETYLTLNLSCDPGPGTACFVAQQVAPFTAIFSNCSTGCLPPFTFLWDFSDGGTIEGELVTHTFIGPGTYAVCLNITGSNGCVASTCQQVVVDANGTINPTTTDPCEADFWVIQAYQGGGTPGGEPIPNELWIWNLSNGGTGNYQFLWSFGDGTSSTEAFPTHVYTQDGPYVLCLTVNDNSGCTNTYCDSISVDEDGMLEGMIVQGHDPHHTLQGERSEGFTINVLDPITMGVPENELNALNTWPNPAQDRLEISLTSIKNGQVRTEVIDANGRRVVGTLHQLVNGQNRITLDVAALPAGMYLLRIGEGQQTVVRRFVKG